MLVQRRGDTVWLIRQNDHALLSGRLAREWVGPRRDDAVGPGVALAIALHDLAWAEADREPVRDPETGTAVPFTDWPDRDREPLQTAGLDLLERLDPLAALLGSLHYVRFLDPDQFPRFAEREAARQGRLRKRLGRAKGDPGVERARLQLRHLDFVSLFVCLTGPGARDAPDWLTAERIGQAPDGTRYRLGWEAADALVCDPFPYRRPFGVAFPYRELALRHDSAEALAAAWHQATPHFREIRVRPA
jgi:hypothetical protein